MNPAGRGRVIEWPQWFASLGTLLAIVAAWLHLAPVLFVCLLVAWLGGVEMELRLRGLSRGGRDNEGRGPK